MNPTLTTVLCAAFIIGVFVLSKVMKHNRLKRAEEEFDKFNQMDGSPVQNSGTNLPELPEKEDALITSAEKRTFTLSRRINRDDS